MTEIRITSPTGGEKGQKPERHELIPGHALDAVARVYAFGASKYKDNNWRYNYPWSLSLGALLRHVNATKKGEWLDSESGEPHLAHAVFHCLAMIEWAATGQVEQNDIYGLELPDEEVYVLAPDFFERLEAGEFDELLDSTPAMVDDVVNDLPKQALDALSGKVTVPTVEQLTLQPPEQNDELINWEQVNQDAEKDWSQGPGSPWNSTDD